MGDRARARESARERTLLSAARLLRPQVFDSLVAARQPRKRRTYAPLLAALSAEAEAAAAAEGAAVVPQAAARAAAQRGIAGVHPGVRPPCPPTNLPPRRGAALPPPPPPRAQHAPPHAAPPRARASRRGHASVHCDDGEVRQHVQH